MHEWIYLITFMSMLIARDPNGETPLHFACHNGNTKIAQIFCNLPLINVNVPDANGNTPLSIALAKEQFEIGIHT